MNPAGLRISKSLTLPLDVVTDTIGILAIKGAGKTYAALVLLEQMVRAGLPVVALDPVGVFWGLRSSADGNGPGLPVVILGGARGDAPLEAEAGRAVADFVIAERHPTIIDFSGFDSKAAQQRFTRELLERLYEANREPLHVMIDEADDVAPQKPFGDEARLLRAVEVLVRRGRARGLGCTLITQRAACINKNVLTQCSTLILGRTVSPQDRAALDSWVQSHGTAEERAQLLESLASLPNREKWVWSPDKAIFARVEIAARETFDSSATPKVGAVRVEPKTLAALDLEGLRAKIAAAVGIAEDDEDEGDDEERERLRARVAELELALTKAPAAAPAAPPAPPPTPVITMEYVARVEAAVRAMSRVCEDVLRGLARLGAPGPAAAAADLPRAVPSRQPPGAAPTNGAGPKLGRCERALLQVLAQRHPKPTTRAQLAILSGYSSTSSGFANALGLLRSRDLAAGAGDAIHATDAGRRAAGPVQPLPPPGKALVEDWTRRLGRCEGTVLRVLAASYPKEVRRELLADMAGYSDTSSGFANALGRLRTLGLVEGLRAAPSLMEGA